jgi:hypothetical protein
MSRPLARTVTSAVLLLSILCFALPAVAAPGGRAQTAKPSIVLGHGLLDQVFSWLSRLLPSPEARTSRQKAMGTLHTSGGVDQAANPNEADRGAMIDPNGNH